MRTLLRLFTIIIGLLYFIYGNAAQPDPRKLIDEFFSIYFYYNPTQGVLAGLHQYDFLLENYNQESVTRKVTTYKKLLNKFKKLYPINLTNQQLADRDQIIAVINSQLLELEKIKMWKKDPDFYSSSIIANGMFVLISRNFAPLDKRLRAIIAREKQAASVLESARHNLKNPPRIYTEIALQQIPGIIRFFEQDMPMAVKNTRDTKLLMEFQRYNQKTILELKQYQQWLRSYLLPRSLGNFRLGTNLYHKKLVYNEMIDIPIQKLLVIGYADLRHNQAQLKKTAKKLDPHRHTDEIMRELAHNHGSPNQLIPDLSKEVNNLVKFIRLHKIATIPSSSTLYIKETPAFSRALSYAGLDTPGPYEKIQDAFFNVTLPDPQWSPKKADEYMQSFDHGSVVTTAIHEAYPGHNLQFLWTKFMPSKTRKLLYVDSNAEGWAHYCEQMMLDMGYGKGNLKLRLAQLRDALLRDARFIVALRLHTGNMTIEQGIQFFMREAYQTRTNAELETWRGTSDPTYLNYTLGKLSIIKLRKDYKKAQGIHFNLQKFHDAFLRQGGAPIPLVRRAMLGHR